MFGAIVKNGMSINPTVAEMEASLGEKLKLLRLNKNLEQKTLAARAGVSVRALRNLESGAGTTVKTLLSVVRALGRETWLDTVAPVATVNPLTFTTRATPRQRARSRGEGARTLAVHMPRQASSCSAGKLQVHAPDPLHINYRQSLTELMQMVVVHRKSLEDAIAEALVEKKDEEAIRAIAQTELDHLELYNCVRYKISREKTHSWILAGRPR